MIQRTILITGAGSGFGKGAAIELARRGHSVVATTETQEQADALAVEHPELTTIKLDVTSSDDIAQAAGLKIDVLINNAGMGVMAPMATVPMDKVRASFNVNVFDMIELTQAVVPGIMERESGRIINVSSVADKLTSPLTSPYCNIKQAVEAYTISLNFIEGLKQNDEVQMEVLTTSIDFWRTEQPGSINPEAWNNMHTVLVRLVQISESLDVSKAYTNAFIP